MKNIMIIIQKLSDGGAERIAGYLSKELSNHYNVIIVVFNGSNISYEYGGTLIDLNIKVSKNRGIKILNFVKKISIIHKLKKKYQIHVSISLLEGANLINVFSKSKETIITSERSFVPNHKITFFKRIKQFILAILSDKVVALSKGVNLNLLNDFKVDNAKLVTIYNPIDIKYIQSKLKEKTDFRFDPEIQYLVTSGRMTYQKGHLELVKTFKLVNDEIPQTNLLILGDGPLKPMIQTLINQLNLQDKVFLLGYQSNPFPYIANSDIFVFTSLFEGFGNVILEAMVCGLPIISSDCLSGPREIIAPSSDPLLLTDTIEHGDYGVLVKPFSFKQYSEEISFENKNLAICLIDFINNKALQKEYSSKSLERILDFEPSKIIRDWVELIESF